MVTQHLAKGYCSQICKVLKDITFRNPRPYTIGLRPLTTKKWLLLNAAIIVFSLILEHEAKHYFQVLIDQRHFKHSAVRGFDSRSSRNDGRRCDVDHNIVV